MADVFEEKVLYLLRRIARLRFVHSRELVRQVGLTGPQLATLYALAQHGENSASRLARLVELSPATMTGVLDRLELKGLLVRRRCEADRRSFRVRPTDRALELLQNDPPLLNLRVREGLALLSADDKERMTSALETLARLMEPADEEPASEPLDVLAH